MTRSILMVGLEGRHGLSVSYDKYMYRIICDTYHKEAFKYVSLHVLLGK